MPPTVYTKIDIVKQKGIYIILVTQGMVMTYMDAAHISSTLPIHTNAMLFQLLKMSLNTLFFDLLLEE